MSQALALVPTEPPETSVPAINAACQVQVARFFLLPLRCSPFVNCPFLVPKPYGRGAGKGIWISSSSLASLQILKHGSSAFSVLMVSLGGKIQEEHFISNLHFSWPQVSCDSQCAGRGSRAILLSYKDCTGQRQKFALRFGTAYEAQTFLCSAKECPMDATEIGVSKSDLIRGSSSHSEFTASNGLQSRGDEASSFEDKNDVYTPELLSLNINDERYESSSKPDLVNHLDTLLSAMPPSFTSLLSNYSDEANNGQPKALERIDLKSQIASCILDPSFQDVLSKVEEIWGEMGGNLKI